MECLQYLLYRHLLPEYYFVLNLVINGMPSIQEAFDIYTFNEKEVLNLVINGMPSILKRKRGKMKSKISFKPCYKWNAFNTQSTVIVMKQ